MSPSSPAARTDRQLAAAARRLRRKQRAEITSVVGCVGMRLSARKRAAQARLFELGRARWNALVRALPAALDSIPREDPAAAAVRARATLDRITDPKRRAAAERRIAALLERAAAGEPGDIRPARGLMAWVGALAPRDPAFPREYADGVDMRVASALWGRHRATSRMASRLRWALEQDDLALGGRGAIDDSGQPRVPMPRERRAELEQRLRLLTDDPLRAALPRARRTPDEALREWLAWLDDVSTRAHVSVVKANQESLRVLAGTDPPPLDVVRRRDAPCVLSPRGVPILLLPAAAGDGTRASLADMHPAWVTANIKGKTKGDVLAVPLTARGRSHQRDMQGRLIGMAGGLPLGEVCHITLVAERTGWRDEDVRYRAQITMTRAAPPEIETESYLAVWFGLFPRLAVTLWSARDEDDVLRQDASRGSDETLRGLELEDGLAVELGARRYVEDDVTALLDDVREAMRVATLDLGPRQHGDHAHAALRSLTHQMTTRLVRFAVERGARLLVADVAMARARMIRRVRIPGAAGRRYRWVASSWNHALIEEQLAAKCRSAGLPDPTSVRVNYYECPACGMGGPRKRDRRTDAAHRAVVDRVRKSGFTEYGCERCGHREAWLRSRARCVGLSWARSQGLMGPEGS